MLIEITCIKDVARCTMERHLRCVLDKNVPPAAAGAKCLAGCMAVNYRRDLSFSSLPSNEMARNTNLSSLMTDFQVAKEAEARNDPHMLEIIDEASQIILPYYFISFPHRHRTILKPKSRWLSHVNLSNF